MRVCKRKIRDQQKIILCTKKVIFHWHQIEMYPLAALHPCHYLHVSVCLFFEYFASGLSGTRQILHPCRTRKEMGKRSKKKNRRLMKETNRHRSHFLTLRGQQNRHVLLSKSSVSPSWKKTRLGKAKTPRRRKKLSRKAQK